MVKIRMRVQAVRSGVSDSGRPYMFIDIGDGIGGFVSFNYLRTFQNVQKGDIVDLKLYRQHSDEGHDTGSVVLQPVAWYASKSCK